MLYRDLTWYIYPYNFYSYIKTRFPARYRNTVGVPQGSGVGPL